MSKIQKDNLFYELLCLSVKFVYQKFFRQIEIRGTENVPTGEPVIFAPNHQNALLDALAVLFYQKGSIVFMARADIFQKKINAWFLGILKLTPIFRIRDGFENLSKNEEQMKVAEDVLLDNAKLCLMPEGNQGNQHKLRPLVKGLFRIAYSTEELLHGKSHIKIIPVGIDCSYYQHAGCDLVLTYGKPIEVKDYIELYKENSSSALNVLRKVLSERMSQIMHHIGSTSHYEIIYNLCCFGTPAYLEIQAEKGMAIKSTTGAGLCFDARCALGKILDKIDAENPEIILELDAYCSQLKKLPGYPTEITEFMEQKMTTTYNIISIMLSIILLPGFIMNFPTWLINHLICKKVDDKQMHSTFAFTIGLLFNAFVYIVATFIIWMFFKTNFIQTVIGFIIISFIGLVCERVRQTLRITFRSVFYSFGSRKVQLKKCRADYALLKEALKKKIRNTIYISK
jgi:1-acyl-sn-glycerol-3-phosphate acyltransferase